MAYVDLNPVGAAMAEDLIDSDFTSIQERLIQYAKDTRQKSAPSKKLAEKSRQKKSLKKQLDLTGLPEKPLMPLGGSGHVPSNQALPFTLEVCFELVDTTGRIIRDDKRGVIKNTPKIIARLGVNLNHWLHHVKAFRTRHATCAGSPAAISDFCSKHQKR
jgi:hypothetical protein